MTFALHRHRASRGRSTGAASPTASVDPLERAARPDRHACSATRTTSTTGISRLVGGPIRAAAQWLADRFDLGIIDGAVNGVARLFRGAALGLRKAQTGLVRQYALGIVLGVVLLLLYALARAGF